MKSSFVRKTPAQAADPGTRPGLHGQTLISMGLVELDKLMGGGLPLGTILLVLEDPHSGQHLNMMRYFMAEGVALKQRVLWLSGQPCPGGVEHFLPAEATSSSTGGSKSASESADNDAELRIAWQYRKYIAEQQSSAATSASTSTSSSKSSGAGAGARSAGTTHNAVEAGISREWCHTFDLTQHMSAEDVKKSGLVHKVLGGSDAGGSCMREAYEEASSFVSQVNATAGLGAGASFSTGGMPVPLKPKGPDSVGRLVVQCLGAPEWWADRAGHQDGGRRGAGAAGRSGRGEDEAQREQQLLRFMLQLKHVVQDSRCSALITCPIGLLRPSTAMRLQHMADSVLRLDPLADDSELFALLPDAASAVALLSVCKLPSVGMLSARLPGTALNVVRNKRRKLTITLVEVDPDAEARRQQQQQQQQTATTAAGQQRGTLGTEGSSGVATKGKAAHALDF